MRGFVKLAAVAVVVSIGGLVAGALAATAVASTIQITDPYMTPVTDPFDHQINPNETITIDWNATAGFSNSALWDPSIQPQSADNVAANLEAWLGLTAGILLPTKLGGQCSLTEVTCNVNGDGNGSIDLGSSSANLFGIHFNGLFIALLYDDLLTGTEFWISGLHFDTSNIYAFTAPTPPEIPLPAGLVLFLTGLAGVGALGRYKSKRREVPTA